MLEQIQKRLPGFPLVMHGSSSVPQEEVARINAAGGKLEGAKGVDENQFRRAAELGVTKVNIDTDGRLVWTRVHREFFRDHPEKFDLRPIRAKFSWANTPSLSPTRTGSWAAPATSKRCARSLKPDPKKAAIKKSEDRTDPRSFLWLLTIEK